MLLQCRLNQYKTWVNPQGNTVLLVKGEAVYYNLVRSAFPGFHFSPRWPDQYSGFDWGVFINDFPQDKLQTLRDLLELFQTVICIDDALNQTFALDFHTLPFQGRTAVGQVVYEAKYQKDTDAAAELVQRLTDFIKRHPAYHTADMLIAVPPSHPGKWSLANLLVGQLTSLVNIRDGSAYVRKTRPTFPMKDIETEEEKFDNIRNAFEVTDTQRIRGKGVILLDDIYHSGATLHELGTTLQKWGATVYGLVATKTWRDVS
jgi:predicted amidophosphoribosyltransferase